MISKTLVWLGYLGAVALVIYAMYFCSFESQYKTKECTNMEKTMCGFFEIITERQGLGPMGFISLRLDIRGSPWSF